MRQHLRGALRQWTRVQTISTILPSGLETVEHATIPSNIQKRTSQVLEVSRTPNLHSTSTIQDEPAPSKQSWWRELPLVHLLPWPGQLRWEEALLESFATGGYWLPFMAGILELGRSQSIPFNFKCEIIYMASYISVQDLEFNRCADRLLHTLKSTPTTDDGLK